MAWIQEIYDILYDPNTICVACISHGKDSLAMLRAIKLLGLPLHRIVTSDVWATQDIPADLPPMWEWKKEADKIIKELYGIEVEHICAMQKPSQNVQVEREREYGAQGAGRFLRHTYESMFYTTVCERGKSAGNIKGFPLKIGEWCKKLKFEKVNIRRYILSEISKGCCNQSSLRFSNDESDMVQVDVEGWESREICSRHNTQFSNSPKNEGRKINIIQYIGIAADEPKRIAKHIGKPNIIMPLVEIGWEEDLCGLISGYQNLLSPVYTTATRDGCWFCHNQSVGQLRLLRKNYPDLWALLLKWDLDSPVSFKPDGRTVHDFDARFALEDEGLISPDDPWKWGYLADMSLQLKMKF